MVKEFITHQDLMNALASLGFPEGDVFRVEIRPRRDDDLLIGKAAEKASWILVAVMSGIQKGDHGEVLPPFATRVVNIPILLSSDERSIISGWYPYLTENELYNLTPDQRGEYLHAAFNQKGTR